MQDFVPLTKGRFQARLAADAADLDAALALRGLCFRGAATAPDQDRFDAACQHVLVTQTDGGRLVCCFRVLVMADGPAFQRGYAAQFYDLGGLAARGGRALELGRFCIAPECAGDPDILRVAWGAMTRLVDGAAADLLFGCSSFAGGDPSAYDHSFAMLAARHLAPAGVMPGVKAPEVHRFARAGGAVGDPVIEPRQAMLGLPPLLRTYLLMGGWVSDHAVIDRDLGTLHVFTGLEIADIPPARARLLREVAG